MALLAKGVTAGLAGSKMADYRCLYRVT